MGVINTNGLVGVVKDVSEHFSTVIPIINLSFTASAELERTGSFGLLRWDGKNHRYAMLNDIPGHVDVREGDTLVTRSASGIYPRGIQIGTVAQVEQKDGSNFHQIKVLLNNDFGQLRYVYVVDNLLRAEQDLIESNTATNVQ
jgi:rod shape-determining protein MreC